MTHLSLPRKPRKLSKRGLDRSQMEQPIKKKKFSYLARSRLRLRLRPQEIWERDYFEMYFLSFPWEVIFRCYFRQLFMYLALKNCKNDGKIFKITLVQIFVR